MLHINRPAQQNILFNIHHTLTWSVCVCSAQKMQPGPPQTPGEPRRRRSSQQSNRSGVKVDCSYHSGTRLCLCSYTWKKKEQLWQNVGALTGYLIVLLFRRRSGSSSSFYFIEGEKGKEIKFEHFYSAVSDTKHKIKGYSAYLQVFHGFSADSEAASNADSRFLSSQYCSWSLFGFGPFS